MDYELVGRMIYGFNRVKGDFDSFCGARPPDGVHADIPVRELADRMVPMLSRQYGADSAIVREFLEVSDILASGEA